MFFGGLVWHRYRICFYVALEAFPFVESYMYHVWRQTSTDMGNWRRVVGYMCY